jgi:SMC interacting uncharacterized protein involved in chromosome segregation
MKGLQRFLNVFVQAQDVLDFVKDADALFDKVEQAKAELERLNETYTDQVATIGKDIAKLKDRKESAEREAAEAERKLAEEQARFLEAVDACQRAEDEARKAHERSMADAKAEFDAMMHSLKVTIEAEQARLDLIQAKIRELKGI